MKMLKFLLFSGLPCVTFCKGHSMLPTLRDGDVILYNPFCRRYSRGDIVIAEVGGEKLVKRVIAEGGDRITITQRGGVAVNGEWLDETYTSGQRTIGRSVNAEIPKGRVWIMGDNRDESSDSRDFGSVPLTDIMGKVIRLRKKVG